MMWSNQRMVSITKVNSIHLTITKDRLSGWVYDTPFDCTVSYTENGRPIYENMDRLKSKWYIKKLIYNTIIHFKYYSDFLNGTVFAITDETIRVNHGKVMLVCYTHFFKLALLKYLDETYNKQDDVLGVFVEITDSKLVTTRVIYKEKEQEIKVENYDEYKRNSEPYRTNTRETISSGE